MRPLSRTILSLQLLFILLLAAPAHAEVVASLVTVGPGDAVWEKFGHNMIRVQVTPPDAEREIDASYNWGLFDFDKPNFILNFVQGRSIYTMAPVPTKPELDLYRLQNRRVTSQRLRLSPEQLRDLLQRCAINYRQNPDYRYDYFRDNCSTRVRDMLDAVTDGALSAAMKSRPTSPSVSYRHEAVRLTQNEFWISLGIDFLAGPKANQPLDLWADGFLPETVAEAATAIAEPRVELWQSTRPPEPTNVPTRWPWLLLAGMFGGGAMMSLTRWRRRAGALAVGFWWLISGFGGVLMLYMWLFTDHVAAHANQNVWCYSPLAWFALTLLLFRKRHAATWIAIVIVAFSVVGGLVWASGRLFGGPIVQANGQFILLALPLNLAAAWAMRQALSAALTKPSSVDEVTGL